MDEIGNLINQVINNNKLMDTLLKENKELMNTIKQIDNLIDIHSE